MPKRPVIYLIAGCNGAGKTTFAREFLPHEVHCLRFLNPDELARGLSPLDPPAAAVKAGRLLLHEIRSCIEKRESFALESTLSGRTYLNLLRAALAAGYEIELHYLWLPSAEEAIARVRERVRKGGHNVPIADVRRRFGRSLEHLVSWYLALATRWAVWDNRDMNPKLIANSESHDISELKQRLQK
jgi:predicted ABC-type ATPase